MHTIFRYITARTLTLFLFAAMLSVLAAVCPRSTPACEVTVVNNTDLKPYQDALRGFRDASTCNVRELKLRGGEEDEDVLLHSQDAIVAVGTAAFKKIRTTTNLPVVYVMVMPSETAPSSLGPNISGVSMDPSPASSVAAIREVFPWAKKIGLLYDPKRTGALVEEAVKAARAAGVELVTKQASNPRELPRLLEELRSAIDLFWMLPDPTVVTAETTDYLLRFSFQSNVPLFSFSSKYVELGAIAALDTDPYDMGTQAAEIVNRLSSGYKGVIREYARASRLSINEKVAAKMGLTIRRDIIKRAKNVE
jgi:putative ABC transport system substrate-binding protein